MLSELVCFPQINFIYIICVKHINQEMVVVVLVLFYSFIVFIIYFALHMYILLCVMFHGSDWTL